MRDHPRQYGRGLCDMFAGARTDDAAAASANFAEVLTLVFRYFTQEK